jgi:hypothetical protein
MLVGGEIAQKVLCVCSEIKQNLGLRAFGQFVSLFTEPSKNPPLTLSQETIQRRLAWPLH